MNEIDITITVFIIFMISTTFISLKYGSAMIRKTGLFLPQVIIAGTINLSLGVFALIGWFLFAWDINEFLFFGGLALGVALLVMGETILITTLFLKRKKWLQIYNETFR